MGALEHGTGHDQVECVWLFGIILMAKVAVIRYGYRAESVRVPRQRSEHLPSSFEFVLKTEMKFL